MEKLFWCKTILPQVFYLVSFNIRSRWTSYNFTFSFLQFRGGTGVSGYGFLVVFFAACLVLPQSETLQPWSRRSSAVKVPVSRLTDWERWQQDRLEVWCRSGTASQTWVWGPVFHCLKDESFIFIGGVTWSCSAGRLSVWRPVRNVFFLFPHSSSSPLQELKLHLGLFCLVAYCLSSYVSSVFSS